MTRGVSLLITATLIACEPPREPASAGASASAPVSAGASASAPVSAGASASVSAPACAPVLVPAEGVLAWVSGCAILIARPIYFEIEKDGIKPTSLPVLDAVAAVLIGEPTLNVEIRGHSSRMRDHFYGRKLSDLRARAVMAYLIKKGVDAKRLRAKGYEDSMPIAPDTEEGRLKNRRIEFWILPASTVSSL